MSSLSIAVVVVVVVRSLFFAKQSDHHHLLPKTSLWRWCGQLFLALREHMHHTSSGQLHLLLALSGTILSGLFVVIDQHHGRIKVLRKNAIYGLLKKHPTRTWHKWTVWRQKLLCQKQYLIITNRQHKRLQELKVLT